MTRNLVTEKEDDLVTLMIGKHRPQKPKGFSCQKKKKKKTESTTLMAAS